LIRQVEETSRPNSASGVRPLRYGFAGTPEFAARILRTLLGAGWIPEVVYTQPDRPSGRGRRLQPSAVKSVAEANNLTTRQPASLRLPDQAAALAEADLDVLVVAAYGLLLPPAILEAPRFGCINVHASMLPRWRGAAPIERAIMAGDTETGACIMRMDEGLDTGPIYTCRPCPITTDTDGPALEARLAALGGEALLECLHGLPDLTPTPQPAEGVSYARKLTRSDAQIDWKQPAVQIERQVRALRGRMPPVTEVGAARMNVLAAQVVPVATGAASRPTPGTIVSAGDRGIQVACGTDALNILRLKLNLGKGLPQSAAEALRGYGKHLAVGAVLGAPAERASGQGRGAP
jgi:methionyl-tRNA formyltransferase